MKKVEMRTVITNMLDNLEEVTSSNKLKAEALLAEIERLGMAPPVTEKLRKYRDHLDLGDYMEYVEKVREWDNE